MAARRSAPAPRVGPLAPGISETAFKDAVVELARLKGWLVMHPLPAMLANKRWVTAVQGDVGWPDLALVHRRRKLFILAELKVGRNRPTPQQVAWLEALHDAGIRAELWRPTEWVNYIAPLILGEDPMADQHYTYTPGTLAHLLHEHLPTLCSLDVERLARAIDDYGNDAGRPELQATHRRGFEEGWEAGLRQARLDAQREALAKPAPEAAAPEAAAS